MRYPTTETIEFMRKTYPTGCEVELVFMDDPQAPQPGTRGKVIMVDAMGTIHVAWENGSSLGVAYGSDICKIIK